MLRYLLCFIICLGGAVCQSQDTKYIILRDGSIIKGEVIDDDEYKVKFVSSNNDTLEYSYKYVLDVLDDTEQNRSKNSHRFRIPKYHKTEGIFLNLDIYAEPIALQVGRRITPSLNIGGQGVIFADPNSSRWYRSNMYGIGPYVKLFLVSDQSKMKPFIDFYIGLGILENNGNYGEVIPYSGLSFGIHLPSRKKVRFYFKVGVFGFQNVEGVNFSSGRKRFLDGQANWTLLGIEF